MLFTYLLKRIIRSGNLDLITADGGTHHMGGEGAPIVVVKLHRRMLNWSLALWPELKIGEAYMNGTLTIEEGSLGDFLKLLMINYKEVRGQPLFVFMAYVTGRMAILRQYNPLGRARRNAAAHYDLPDQLYDFFLDKDRQYSCAYFTDPNNSLDQAQFDKKRHIAAKLFLNKPRLRVLDIGCGWGGMGLYLASSYACHVTGITLSMRQYKISRERAQASGLDRVCRFDLRDYRQQTGTFDRIVSVGMFEHVGKKNYDEFFQQIHRLLADDGVCVLHSIGSFKSPGPSNAFIRKYIFPGGDIPSLSEVTEAIQQSGLFITDVEILRLHYAETLKKWKERFSVHRDEIVKAYGEAFYRKWEFYLISCEMGFRYYGTMVMQIQLSKKLESVPITRDYMYEREHAGELSAFTHRLRQQA